MKIETRDNRAFFKIKPGERVFVSFGSTEVEVGTTPDLTLGEMALVVTIPGDYTHNRVDLGKGEYETRFVVTGGTGRDSSRYCHLRSRLRGLSKWIDTMNGPEEARKERNDRYSAVGG